MNFSKIILTVVSIVLFGNAIAQDSIPAANREIINYVNSVIGKKVDRGECWDLANEALIKINAKWDRKFVYGKLLNPEKDVIYPGDIIQFKNVVVEYKIVKGNETQTTTESMKQHTAIVHKVLAKGEFELAHQNTQFSGRKVGLSDLNIKYIKKGKIFIYRPVVE